MARNVGSRRVSVSDSWRELTKPGYIHEHAGEMASSERRDTNFAESVGGGDLLGGGRWRTTWGARVWERAQHARRANVLDFLVCGSDHCSTPAAISHHASRLARARRSRDFPAL